MPDGLLTMPPSPELREQLKKALADARSGADVLLTEKLGFGKVPRTLGFDDGVIFPPDSFPFGTPLAAIRNAAAERAPLRGVLRVIVVLVQFSDKPFGNTSQRFNDLFFSTGVLPHGSVKEYFKEVSGGLVDITGEVVGPFTMPQTMAWYANGNSGLGTQTVAGRANAMARDAAMAANASVDFSHYDNDGNGYVDAFIVVHAGSGAEQTGNNNDIWSHKWTLPAVMVADGKNIYPYLTIPENARLGVCAHELGHLLFGLPDLYDTDNSSEGIGNWCLMAGGSWNGGGDIPAHPSAWCKMTQGWVTVKNVTSSGTLSFPDVKTQKQIYRLWKDGGSGSEYFLIENRQKTGYDAALPGSGLLIWHIDESQPSNTDQNHYKVALVQADNLKDLELDKNRGDSGDPYPGTSNNTSFNATSSPNSKSYANQTTCVSITNISPSGPVMTAKAAVSCFVKNVLADTKIIADGKHLRDKLLEKHLEKRKELEKGSKELTELPGDGSFRPPIPLTQSFPNVSNALHQQIALLEARLSALEAGRQPTTAAEPFISAALRPALQVEPIRNPAIEELQTKMEAGDRDAKRQFDTIPIWNA